MRAIRWFDEIDTRDINLVGGKGANLGEMCQAGLPVPPGFCVVAPVYRDFILTSGLKSAIQEMLDSVQLEDPADLEHKTARIRELIDLQPLPTGLIESTIDSYQKLASRMHATGESIPVAVRSSATAEDLPTASFAGQQDTYLNIRGAASLLNHIRRCWASLWTARAVNYRARQGFDHQKVYLSVVVQAMISSEVSGILFTANPVNRNQDEVVINASPGLGEAVVSGLVTPDTLTVRKSDRTVVSHEIGKKALKIEYAPEGGTLEVEIPPEQRSLPALTHEQTLSLVDLGCQIEAHYGRPQDIEFGFAEGQLYVLQSRPITTIPSTTVGEDEDEYNRSMFIEIFPDPLSPIFLSVVRPLFKEMLDFTFEAWGFRAPEDIKAIGTFYNQPYFNRRYIEAALGPLSPRVREPLVARIVNPFGGEQEEEPASLEMSLPFLGMAARTLRFMIRFPARLPGLLDGYQQEVAGIEAYPMEDATDRELVIKINHLLFEAANELLNYDFLMIAVIHETYRILGTALRRYYGDQTEELVARLISGVTGNVTMETNKRLWDLAEIARASDEVCELLRDADEREVLARLKGSAHAGEFLRALQAFLAEYGHRELRMDILYPTWREDPTPVLAFVRSYLEVDEQHSPHHQQTRLVRERNELTGEVLGQASRTWVGRWVSVPILRWILEQTQTHTRQRDTMHFELTRLFPPARRLLLELGRRWNSRELIDRPEDIFFIEINELLELASYPHPMKEEVEARRADFEESKGRPWPEIVRGGEEIYLQEQNWGNGSGNLLKGVAGSPGRVTGEACIIRGPEGFAHLQKGQILVAPLTNPVWTPLFAIASGVITEVGGILSHGAIVAREYGIPAVMSVPGATRHIADGQQITVDGDKGVVHLDGEVLG